MGALGALNRVFLNIGLFSEEWTAALQPARRRQTDLADRDRRGAQELAYWQATEAQTPAVAAFFLKTHRPAPPQRRAGRRGLPDHRTTPGSTAARIVFAETCARCHSSKLPHPPRRRSIPAAAPDRGYLDCWNSYWAWTKTAEFKQKMREIVSAPDFLDDNFLSTDFRVPVTLLQTNACSPLATNAIAGNIWDNFSSQSYKTLPSVGTITVHDPFTGEPRPYQMPAGGRGYTRPASLISLWSTAPFLLNNSVGKFNSEPSVAKRMDSFENSIEQMLWPEKRQKDSVLGDKVPGLIDRTTGPSYFRVPAGYLPDFVRTHPELATLAKRVTPSIFGDGGIEIGPIPTGTPVNLLSNVNLRPDNLTPAQQLQHDAQLVDLLLKLKLALLQLPQHPTEAQARQAFAPLAKPLLALSKCPDFVVNRGHYFGTSLAKDEPGLSDDDKRALIEFLKTF